MSKGPKISRTVRKLIEDQALEDRITSRRVLAVRLKELIDHLGEPVPKEETLERLISKARNQISPLDTAWSLGTLIKYPIPPESLPAVFLAYAAEYIVMVGQYGRPLIRPPLTIRQAHWVSRLFPLMKNFKRDIPQLIRLAKEYSLMERASESAGGRFGTEDLDYSLMSSNAETICRKLEIPLNKKAFPDITWVEIRLHQSGKEARYERSHSEEVQE